MWLKNKTKNKVKQKKKSEVFQHDAPFPLSNTLSYKISDMIVYPHFGQVELSHAGNLLLTGTWRTIIPMYHNLVPSARPNHFRGSHLTMASNGRARKGGKWLRKDVKF